jgi:hypothetical protein
MSCGRAEPRGRFDVRVTVRSATVSTYQRHNFFNRRDVIGDPGFHCWRHARICRRRGIRRSRDDEGADVVRALCDALSESLIRSAAGFWKLEPARWLEPRTC